MSDRTRIQRDKNAGRLGGELVAVMYAPEDTPDRWELLASPRVGADRKSKAKRWTPRRAFGRCER